MKSNHSLPSRRSTGFTLIEMLVVIGIIGILAGILLPTLGYAKRKAKITLARMEMANLTAAIHQYIAEYNRPPLSKQAFSSVNESSPDFTCGTVFQNGTTAMNTRIESVDNNGYQNCNSEVMAILLDLDYSPNEQHRLNPRQLKLFHAKEAADNSSPGLGKDRVLRDPWGSPYIITLDVNDDGQCQDGFYYPLTKGPDPWLPHVEVMIWSFGPDRAVDIDWQVGPNGGANKDNILSWK